MITEHEKYKGVPGVYLSAWLVVALIFVAIGLAFFCIFGDDKFDLQIDDWWNLMKEIWHE